MNPDRIITHIDEMLGVGITATQLQNRGIFSAKTLENIRKRPEAVRNRKLEAIYTNIGRVIDTIQASHIEAGRK